MAKRLFDLLMSALGLLVLVPLFIVIALWIKRDSPGPVFFRQERVGRHGRSFHIHKFRTMRAAPVGQGGLQLTVGADPRITRSGHFLRRHKLDELPQLIDVFRGKMSLVGPRPEVPRYVAHYPKDVRDKVLSVRPGITDPASIEFRREAELLARSNDPERTYIEVVMPQKLQLALRYVEQAGLRADLRLILRTVQVLVRG
jgi:lipopolysaccharide/colanic/teichoic acid biosynthesis glycosyltransferase